MSYFVIFFTFLWILFLIYTYRGQKHLKSLDDIVYSDSEGHPKISIIIAVKDDAKDLERTLQNLVNLNYPEVEVIVVNDRSSDHTEEVIKHFQKESPATLSINIQELPKGWLGKVHALHQGVKLATGDFLLFMDADIQMSGEVLKKTFWLCENLKLDHLGVLPRVKQRDYWLNMMMSTSMLLFTLSARPWLTIGKRPLASIKGVGAFNLVRRSAFDKTEGFVWLKMDVADDVALAQLIAKNGGRSYLIKAGIEGPKLDWYEDFRHFVLGLEKNVVGGFTNYKISLVFIISLVSILTFIVPLIGLTSGLESLVFFLSTFIFAVATKRYSNYSLLTIFALPLGIALMGLILLRSAFICFKQGGIRWSGTFYPLKDLREGSRVKLGL